MDPHEWVQRPGFKRWWWQFALSTVGIGCVLTATALFGDLEGRLAGFAIVAGVLFTLFGLLLVLAGMTGHHELAVRILDRYLGDDDPESRSGQ